MIGPNRLSKAALLGGLSLLGGVFARGQTLNGPDLTRVPRVFMSYKPDGRDLAADCRDMKAHGVDVVQFGCSGVENCRSFLAAARAAGLKVSSQIADVTEDLGIVRAVGLKPVHALMIGGAYRGQAIDRHVFAFTPARHTILVEPPVYHAGFRARRGNKGLTVCEKGEPILHYFAGAEPVRAEIVVAERPFDGKQHLKIIPADWSLAPVGTQPEVDTITDPTYFATSEYRTRRLVSLSFDLTGLDAALLDRVNIAVYWRLDTPPAGYASFKGGMSAPAAAVTREAVRRETRRRLQMWRDANGGTFPAADFAAFRFGDESFLATAMLGAPCVSYPLWDFSADGVAAFRALAGSDLAYPRTWGRADLYGADAYGLWMYAFHKSCAELAALARATVQEAVPGLPVFRNTTRMGVFSLANDRDGTGQELLARVFDLVHLDPYPVHGAAYNEKIPADMSYCAGFARRFKKPLFPWMQAHVYSALTHPTPEQVRRMAEEHAAQGVDCVQWLGYGPAKTHTFPGHADSWTEAARFHDRLHRAPFAKPRAELAVLRPYSVRALAHEEGDGLCRNPADFMLQQFLLAWSVDRKRAYDVFEIPPIETAEEKAARARALTNYTYIVSTVPYPGAQVIGAGTEGTCLRLREAARLRARYRNSRP